MQIKALNVKKHGSHEAILLEIMESIKSFQSIRTFLAGKCTVQIAADYLKKTTGTYYWLRWRYKNKRQIIKQGQ